MRRVCLLFMTTACGRLGFESRADDVRLPDAGVTMSCGSKISMGAGAVMTATNAGQFTVERVQLTAP